jgi:hypothetical protein
MRVLFLTIFFLSFVFFVSANAQEIEEFRYWSNGVEGIPKTWVFASFSQNEITKIKRRWDEIGESLKTTSNPFAGTYFQSGNRGYYLRWSPEKGFVYVRYYEYFVRGVSYGKVSVTNSEVTFIPEHESQNEDTERKLITPTIWIPAYNEKQFLVQKESIQSFGDFYGGFGVFNGFPSKWVCECSPYAKKIDKKIDYTKIKSFIVPEKYLKFIKQPITAKIISVGASRISNHKLKYPDSDSRASITPVTINIGRRSGIKKGLLFNVIEEDEFLEITKVGKKTSKAIIVRQIDENGKESFRNGWDNTTDKPIYKPYPPLPIGTDITTKVDMRIFDRY